MLLSQKFHVAGVANSTVTDDGLFSTESEKKTISHIRLVLDEVADNDVHVYHEKTKIHDIPDRLFDVENSTGAINLAKPGARINDLEIAFPIPVGESIKIAIKCGATATDIYGAYFYEIGGGA